MWRSYNVYILLVCVNVLTQYHSKRARCGNLVSPATIKLPSYTREVLAVSPFFLENLECFDGLL